MYVSHCILTVLFSFAIGSIPFGVLLAKLFRLPDPRSIGSGNIGATNMLRTGNKKVAALTLLLDAAKGLVPVILAYQWFDAGAPLAALALLVALASHCYTPFLRGKGGKGVATALGGAFALSWPVGIAFCCSWLLTFMFTRYVSLASIVALVSIALVAWLRLGGDTALIVGFAALIGIWRHRENMKRLRAGTEPKMMGKKHA
jgi:glycerol-3-phosphate acyltransferase PlsY